jgi:serine/threonine protein kinase
VTEHVGYFARKLPANPCIVFAAVDPYLRRELAVKLLHPAPRAAEGADDALLTEAQNTARLVHPGVVTVFDAGLHEGRVFVAMELVAGQTMAQWLTARPPWQHAIAVLARAARGIEAAHACGIIHRDFKPANVLLGTDGRVCVADFGLAREIGDGRFVEHVLPHDAASGTARARTMSGEVAGTPAYMAPEQYLGMAQDERTDQFAFCVALYEALWGRRPFQASSLPELKERMLKMDPVMPSSPPLPRELTSAVSRGLSKRRQDRFASMGELAQLLESFSADVEVRKALSVPPAPEPVEAPRESMYDAYLRMLPDGLDTAPGAVVPSRVTQLILAQKPLKRAPPELLPIVRLLYTQHAISQVQTRALMCAFYDEHFDSLADFEAFMKPMGVGVMRVIFGLHACPEPSSPHYIDVLLSVYNNATPGMVLQAVEKKPWFARVRVEHPAHTVVDVHRVAIASIVRSELLVTGSTLAEVRIVGRADDYFELTARWH